MGDFFSSDGWIFDQEAAPPLATAGFAGLFASPAFFSYLIASVSLQVAGRGETKSVTNGEFSHKAPRRVGFLPQKLQV